jgi:Leu/Phe-tRNA-protein transferase
MNSVRTESIEFWQNASNLLTLCGGCWGVHLQTYEMGQSKESKQVSK